MPDKNFILSKEAAQEKLHRMALEIAENISEDDAPLVLVGVRNSGVVIAKKIMVYLQQYMKTPIKLIDVSFDKHLPAEIILSEQIDFTEKNVIIIDDVTNTGKTLLYALKPLLAFYPKRIQTLVLVERMHKLFPVKPDYVGLSVATTLQDHIIVEVEKDEITGAYVQ
ncbi:MAG: phosphoribosyltransferase family protein [Chitinophagaceae bacterium]